MTLGERKKKTKTKRIHDRSVLELQAVCESPRITGEQAFGEVMRGGNGLFSHFLDGLKYLRAGVRGERSKSTEMAEKLEEQSGKQSAGGLAPRTQ